MLYGYVVGKSIRRSFEHVNNHRWDELLKADMLRCMPRYSLPS